MRLVGYIAEVTGLSPNVTEKEIYDFFSCCGKIEHLEIFRYRDQICTAYVTFRGAYAVESAVLLSGATIGNQCVSISRLEISGDESVPEDDHPLMVEDVSSSSESQADQFVSTPGEAITVAQQVVTSMIAKGHELSREALIKAKALDESYQVSSTAAAKVAEFSNKMGLTDKIHSSVEAVKSVDNKYHVSDITITVASATGRTAVSTANAVVNSRYFSMGALWVARLLDRGSITQVIDPKLHQHLETLGGGDYLFAFRMLMVLFRREFSFCDSLYLWEMMWALEYDPDFFSLYEEPDPHAEKSEGSEGSKGKPKSIRQYGKFERDNMRNGVKSDDAPLPISVFLVASVLKDKSPTLLTEARGLDDVVKILNDMTGNLDAKKACTGAMKLHKKYLKARKP